MMTSRQESFIALPPYPRASLQMVILRPPAGHAEPECYCLNHQVPIGEGDHSLRPLELLACPEHRNEQLGQMATSRLPGIPQYHFDESATSPTLLNGGHRPTERLLKSGGERWRSACSGLMICWRPRWSLSRKNERIPHMRLSTRKGRTECGTEPGATHFHST